MEIVQYPTSSYLHDLPDIVLDNVASTSTVTITFGEHVFTEQYSPDSEGKITISGLGDMLEDYFDSLAHSPLAASAVPASHRLSIAINNDTQSFQLQDCDVYPCRDRVGSAPSARFLTQLGERELHREPFFLCFYGGSRLLFIVTKSNGTQLTSEVPSKTLNPSPQVANIITLDYAFLAKEFSLADGEQILHFEARLVGSDDNILDTYVVHFTPTAPRFAKIITFDNIFLVPDAIVFRGSEQETREYATQLGTIQGRTRRLSTDTHTEYALNSGLITEAEFRTAESILAADELYAYVDDELVPIVATGCDIQYSQPKERSAVFTLRYRLSYLRTLHLQRHERHTGIFTQTFDKPFD